MSLVWGVNTFYYDKTEGIDDTLHHIEEILVEQGLLQKGDVVISTASMPAHWEGHTNMIKVDTIGEV
jgi:pyruvate kinase